MSGRQKRRGKKKKRNSPAKSEKQPHGHPGEVPMLPF